jgi:CheY-like chemotaxis protein
MLVLIVEDNKDQAITLSMVLRAWGFKTEIAYDGLTALEMASRAPPDAVLADLGLPGIDGFELAKRLGAKPEFKECLMAAVSGYTDEDSRSRSKAAGLVEHFGKPVDLHSLYRLLHNRRTAIAEA